jgi:hypothetical protein
MSSGQPFYRKLSTLWRAEFCSPKDLVRRAAVIALVFLVIHLAGLREYTSILNGTPGSVEMSWRTSALLGLTYIFAYLAFVLLAPILLLAAAILAVWKRLRSANAGQPANSLLSSGPDTRL